MRSKTIMVVAGDPSGDVNAAGLVKALACALPQAQFIGAGGPKMAEAGVQLSFNLTDDAAIGPADALKKLRSFWKRCQQLASLALERRPELIILVDFYTFNHKLAQTIRTLARADNSGWEPKIVQYTSPQVWASRPGRAEKLARNIDLLLCLFPFEKEWYAKRGTPLRVEFVGHPMFDRHNPEHPSSPNPNDPPIVVLLPGSRMGELKRHLPVMLDAAAKIAATRPARFKLVASNERMAEFVRTSQHGMIPKVEVQIGQLADALSTATIAITKTGTITLECAYFKLPIVAMYKVSPLFYLMAKPLVTVKYAAWPNLLAGEMLCPEFIQSQATAENIAKAALDLLTDDARREAIRARMQKAVDALGGSGSTQRAAALLLQMLA